MTVQEYLTQLQKGRTIRPINTVEITLELAPPDPHDARQGFDYGLSPDDAYQAWMAFSAWLREYRRLHLFAYRSMIARQPQ